MTMTLSIQALQRLTRFYNAGFRAPLVDTTLPKVLEQQIARDEADLAQVVARLAELEVQYQLASDVFAARYDAGQMPDDADYVEWRAYCKMRQRLEERLSILRGEDCHA